MIDIVPAGLKLLVKKRQKIYIEQPLTNNPNVGSFGQIEEEIVLQYPERIQKLLILFDSYFLLLASIKQLLPFFALE